MRLGISSSLKHSSPEEWAGKQIALGCRAVVFPVNCRESDAKITAYKEAAEKCDLMIAEVGIWCNAMSPDDEERKKNLEYSIGQLKMADYVGARCAVNVAGSTGARWDGHYKENFSADTRKRIVETVQTIIDKADVKNTYFTLEPMPWMVPTGPEDYLRLMEEIDRERFAVHMDMINMVNSAERYFNTEELIDNSAKLLGKKIRSCHIKDVHLAEEFTFRLEECAPGMGEFPLKYYADKMNEIDNDMPVILEHLNTDEDYIKYFAVLKEKLYGV